MVLVRATQGHSSIRSAASQPETGGYVRQVWHFGGRMGGGQEGPGGDYWVSRIVDRRQFCQFRRLSNLAPLPVVRFSKIQHLGNNSQQYLLNRG